MNSCDDLCSILIAIFIVQSKENFKILEFHQDENKRSKSRAKTADKQSRTKPRLLVN
jgi:hypothetical protein